MKSGINLHTIVLSALLFVLSMHTTAQNCDYLDDLALVCLDRKLSAEDSLMDLSACSDTALNKTILIHNLFRNEYFISNLIMNLRLELLQGTSHEDIVENIFTFDFLTFSQPDQKEMAEGELERLYKVFRLEREYMDHRITFEDMIIAYFDNFTYDQQNMGENNFINSTFAYVINRPPTKQEYKSASDMINDHEATLFYKDGSSKADYLRILTSNDNFLEGQVRYWYYYFLFRYPETDEVYDILTNIHESSGKVDIAGIIEYILLNKI